MSDEAVCIPPNLAAEMTAYDPTSGELRTHYAGFFDPGFGFDPTGGFGLRATLEVRAHDVPFMVENGQSVCKLTFERMLEEPTALYGSGIGSSYQQQIETLSRYFRRSQACSHRKVVRSRRAPNCRLTPICGCRRDGCYPLQGGRDTPENRGLHRPCRVDRIGAFIEVLDLSGRPQQFRCSPVGIEPQSRGLKAGPVQPMHRKEQHLEAESPFLNCCTAQAAWYWLRPACWWASGLQARPRRASSRRRRRRSSR